MAETGLAYLMQNIEAHAEECRTEIHKIVALDYSKQVKIVLAFEAMLDRIEDTIRDACTRPEGP